MVGDAADEAILDLEEGTDTQTVTLAGGRGQAVIGGEVLAFNEKLGGTARAVLTSQGDKIANALAVAAIHAGEEVAEGLLAQLAGTLIDVVRHVRREEGEEGGTIAGIESVVVGSDQAQGLLLGSGHGQGERQRKARVNAEDGVRRRWPTRIQARVRHKASRIMTMRIERAHSWSFAENSFFLFTSPWSECGFARQTRAHLLRPPAAPLVKAEAWHEPGKMGRKSTVARVRQEANHRRLCFPPA